LQREPRGRCIHPLCITMIFGDRASFAIEALVEPDLVAPSAVWGRMRIWIREESIGDFEDSRCALYPSYMGFMALQRELGALWLPEFDGLDDQALWDHLDALLYVEDSRSDEQVSADAIRYGKFIFLTNWGEQFDRDGKSFVVCHPNGTVRILNLGLPGRVAREVCVADVRLSISRFVQWFELESERLRGEVDA